MQATCLGQTTWLSEQWTRVFMLKGATSPTLLARARRMDMTAQNSCSATTQPMEPRFKGTEPNRRESSEARDGWGYMETHSILTLTIPLRRCFFVAVDLAYVLATL